MTTPVTAANVVDVVQNLVNAIYVPGQTPQQEQLGELTFDQVRAKILQISNELTGDPSVPQMKDWIKNAAPKLIASLDEHTNDIKQIKEVTQPLFQRTDEALKKLEQAGDDLEGRITQLGDYANKVREDLSSAVSTAVSDQTGNLDLVAQEARDQFKKIDTDSQDLFKALQLQFQTMTDVNEAIMTDGKKRFENIDVKFAGIDRVQKLIAGVVESDVAAIRSKLAEANLQTGSTTSHHGFGNVRPIFVYKVVAALEHYNGENRTEYKAWIKKLKNVLFQARGEEWRKALDALERHRVSTDFEELVSLDDKWDDWFEENFGLKRVDGKNPIDLNMFKLDLDFILTDKLGKSLLTVIQPHKYNGLRGYKKLFIWCVDISDSVKNTYMQRIMRPHAARNDASQAEAIETWDRERAELVLIDPQCELRAPFLLSAFKCLLTPTFSNYVNNHLDPSMREDYDFIRSKIYNWALRLRFEGKQDTGSPLAAFGESDEPNCFPCEQAEGYWGGSGYGYHEPLDAMGKGKQGAKNGGGKGVVCWNCSQPGHLARNCLKPPKGKGKSRFPKGGGKAGKGGKGSKGKFQSGKGKGAYAMDWQEPQPVNAVNQFQGYCNGCGGWGHTWRYCKTTNPNAETLPVRSFELQPERDAQYRPAAENAPAPVRNNIFYFSDKICRHFAPKMQSRPIVCEISARIRPACFK